MADYELIAQSSTHYAGLGYTRWQARIRVPNGQSFAPGDVAAMVDGGRHRGPAKYLTITSATPTVDAAGTIYNMTWVRGREV